MDTLWHFLNTTLAMCSAGVLTGALLAGFRFCCTRRRRRQEEERAERQRRTLVELAIRVEEDQRNLALYLDRFATELREMRLDRYEQQEHQQRQGAWRRELAQRVDQLDSAAPSHVLAVPPVVDRSSSSDLGVPEGPRLDDDDDGEGVETATTSAAVSTISVSSVVPSGAAGAGPRRASSRH